MPRLRRETVELNQKENKQNMIQIPDEKKIRVIIDTDAACEADDPYAIVQDLIITPFYRAFLVKMLRKYSFYYQLRA